MFLPATNQELKKFGWKHFDIILVSGDTYIDSHFTGIAVIGNVLVKKGFRVGIIVQLDIDSDKDIKRLGEPLLFWGGGAEEILILLWQIILPLENGEKKMIILLEESTISVCTGLSLFIPI